MTDAVATWRGALLWPQALPDAVIIDCSQVTVVGVWAIAELRRRGRRRLVAAPAQVRSLLALLDVPCAHFATLREACQQHGVTASERAALYGLVDDLVDGLVDDLVKADAR